ncbi:MAG: aminopeptidase N [Kiritimatiellia bacterium]|jgi:aminopeptidase N
MRTFTPLLILAPLAGALTACSPEPEPEPEPKPLLEDWARDLLHTDLTVDLSTNTAMAAITVAASGSTSLSLDVAGLQIDDVLDMEGNTVNYRVLDGRLDVITAADTQSTVAVNYHFSEGSEGVLANGSTLTWPYYCGHLFPCHTEPSDGLTFSLQVAGTSGTNAVVYPSTLPADAPSYQLAWAVGDYDEHVLGTTSGGTEVVIWTLAGSNLDVDKAGILLPQFEWLEDTLGPYSFGPRAGAVEVNWGGGAYGGMEHHPFWHTASGAMSDELTQLHEAAHGWYGGGLRLLCWEDFVLSEGTVSYLAAKGIGASRGAEAEREVWAAYRSRLEFAVRRADHVAWPQTCGEVDILDDGLFSTIPYMKGAFFYKALEDVLGEEQMLAVLGSFYRKNVGRAVRMEGLLEHVQAETAFDPHPLAQAWLLGLGIPE